MNAWAMKGPDGKIDSWSIRDTEKAAWFSFFGGKDKFWTDKGYTCVPVHIVEASQEDVGVVRKLMARLADLLDDDKFNECEAIVRSYGIEPQPSHEAARQVDAVYDKVKMPEGDEYSRAYMVGVNNTIAALRAASPERVPAGMVVQDSRSYVGNDMLFWQRGGGYTTNLDDAEVFPPEVANRMHRSRSTDIPWSLKYLRGKSRPAVDMQYVSRDHDGASAPDAGREGK